MGKTVFLVVGLVVVVWSKLRFKRFGVQGLVWLVEGRGLCLGIWLLSPRFFSVSCTATAPCGSNDLGNATARWHRLVAYQVPGVVNAFCEMFWVPFPTLRRSVFFSSLFHSRVNWGAEGDSGTCSRSQRVRVAEPGVKPWSVRYGAWCAHTRSGCWGWLSGLWGQDSEDAWGEGLPVPWCSCCLASLRGPLWAPEEKPGLPVKGKLQMGTVRPIRCHEVSEALIMRGRFAELPGCLSSTPSLKSPGTVWACGLGPSLVLPHLRQSQRQENRLAPLCLYSSDCLSWLPGSIRKTWHSEAHSLPLTTYLISIGKNDTIFPNLYFSNASQLFCPPKGKIKMRLTYVQKLCVRKKVAEISEGLVGGLVMKHDKHLVVCVLKCKKLSCFFLSFKVSICVSLYT